MSVAVLIPAYQPDGTLASIVRALSAMPEVSTIAVVNDGSSQSSRGVFEDVQAIAKARVLLHETNRGKGAALRTGFEHLLGTALPDCVVVTADADGQHLPADILAVGQEGKRTPEALVLGSRAFDGRIPLRSRFGNVMTRHVLRWAIGCALRDTQTGLRAIPRALIPHLLEMDSPRYEFELEMLMMARHHGVAIREVPIQTVYEPGNPTSHFDPIRDSARIYASLLRFKMRARARAGAARV